jgi:hypothetical protein
MPWGKPGHDDWVFPGCRVGSYGYDLPVGALWMNALLP